MNKLIYPLLVIVLGSSVACTDMSQREQGALSGAAAGAGISALTGGNGWTGAAIGAAAGAVVGDMKGKKAE
ncbi:MAG: glycine zipper 2TM domain-containing protein [gamma proteobacterium symbiont of Lucinoma myriamae]|nr:glycine zipper 2TM domain-containing protein [gamma proteobacterium symbiont of Lucinoma myriamae]MCU7831767.1 glycine zipper 2TM domain-containing protein [gamma proteobacterium symbiont of Lucinoma myriamae]